MQKTTVYLPDGLKAELERTAVEIGRGEAQLIREGIRLAIASHTPLPPTIGILVSDAPTFAERVDELLVRFDER